MAKAEVVGATFPAARFYELAERDAQFLARASARLDFIETIVKPMHDFKIRDASKDLEQALGLIGTGAKGDVD